MLMVTIHFVKEINKIITGKTISFMPQKNSNHLYTQSMSENKIVRDECSDMSVVTLIC